MSEFDKALRRFKWGLAAFCCAMALFVGEHLYFFLRRH